MTGVRTGLLRPPPAALLFPSPPAAPPPHSAASDTGALIATDEYRCFTRLSPPRRTLAFGSGGASLRSTLVPSNSAVQPDAAGAALTWAQVTRKLRSPITDPSALAFLQRRPGNPAARPVLSGAASQFAGTSSQPARLALTTPASGAADSYPLGGPRASPSYLWLCPAVTRLAPAGPARSTAPCGSPGFPPSQGGVGAGCRLLYG